MGCFFAASFPVHLVSPHPIAVGKRWIAYSESKVNIPDNVDWLWRLFFFGINTSYYCKFFLIPSPPPPHCRSRICTIRWAVESSTEYRHTPATVLSAAKVKETNPRTRQSSWVETGAFPWRVGGAIFFLAGFLTVRILRHAACHCFNWGALLWKKMKKNFINEIRWWKSILSIELPVAVPLALSVTASVFRVRIQISFQSEHGSLFYSFLWSFFVQKIFFDRKWFLCRRFLRASQISEKLWPVAFPARKSRPARTSSRQARRGNRRVSSQYWTLTLRATEKCVSPPLFSPPLSVLFLLFLHLHLLKIKNFSKKF